MGSNPTLTASNADREFAYAPDSKVGTFSDAMMKEAKEKGWTVVSIKNDWNTVFPPKR